jgi:hypothetical protein
MKPAQAARHRGGSREIAFPPANFSAPTAPFENETLTEKTYFTLRNFTKLPWEKIALGFIWVSIFLSLFVTAILAE